MSKNCLSVGKPSRKESLLSYIGKKHAIGASGLGISWIGVRKRSGKTFIVGYAITVGSSVWLIWPIVNSHGVEHGYLTDNNLDDKFRRVRRKLGEKSKRYRRKFVSKK